MRETKELAAGIGRAWFAVAIGVLVSAYGGIQLVTHSHESGWLWVSVGLVIMLGVTLMLAHRALRERNAALSMKNPAPKSHEASVVFQGGEHHHYYKGPLPKSEESED